MLQSLMVTCRLHDINPYTYLLDVLQRVGSHPASKVDELIPRNWKQLFAEQPMGAACPQNTIMIASNTFKRVAQVAKHDNTLEPEPDSISTA